MILPLKKGYANLGILVVGITTRISLSDENGRMGVITNIIRTVICVIGYNLREERGT